MEKENEQLKIEAYILLYAVKYGFDDAYKLLENLKFTLGKKQPI